MDAIGQVLKDPSTSRWLKEALQASLSRDSVDAVNDADLLAELLDGKLREDQEDMRKELEELEKRNHPIDTRRYYYKPQAYITRHT